MVDKPFSQRHGFAPQPGPLAYNEIPPWLRETTLNLIRQFAETHDYSRFPATTFGYALYQLLRPLVWRVLQREPPGNPYNGPWAYYIPAVIQQCEWWQFYDICELIHDLISKEYPQGTAELFSEEVNALFTREGVVWQFKDGKIGRAYPSMISERIEEVGTLLQDPRFEGPDEQFEKARRHLDKRPEPDTENCVKDAVGAMEAVARIVAGDHKSIMPDILKREPFKSGIHPALRIVIEKIYGYRGDVAAHGQVGPSQIGIEEAEWVLMISAATILYLANKFARQTP